MVIPAVSQNEPQCSSRFDYEYKVVQKLVDLENFKTEQNEINKQLMRRNKDLETEIENLRNSSKEAILNLQSECKEANKEFKANLEVANNAIEALATKVENLSNLPKDGASRHFYGFSAYQCSTTRLLKGSTIVLTRTRLNEDSVYNSGAGQFTAPVSGVYVFHATLCTNTGGSFIYVAFMADGEVIGRFSTNDNALDICTSGSALARLQKGNKVYLQVTLVSSGTVLRDDSNHMNSLSGFFVGL